MTQWLDQFFKIRARNSTIKTEFLAALTTFATMSYVLAVHPMILADAGMDRAAMITVTALAAGVFSILMGVMANLPIAQAPGMGSNALFAYTIVLAMGVPWEAALGLTFWSGVIFLLLTVTGVRQLLLEAFPDAIKIALTVGIGLFLLFIGLKNAGIVVSAPAPVLVTIGEVTQPSVFLALLGIPIVIALTYKRIPGGILLTILAITFIGWLIPAPDGASTLTPMPSALASMPVSPAGIFGALDLVYLWTHFAYAFPVLLSLVFIDLFSSLVAINAMCFRAGLTDDEGNVVQPQKSLSADAIATIGASVMGTSTTNVYGESAAGIETGGRTGLTAIFVGLFFFLAIFFNPIFMIIPAHATAPALIFIGLLMFSEVRRIDFSDISVSGPASLCLIMMAVTSISDGLALGLLSYILTMIFSGRLTSISPMSWILGVSFTLYYALV